MDTLIDKRQFPQEMQQTPNFKANKKNTPWLLILLIIFALGIIVFLICNIFINKDNTINNKIQKPTLEEKVEIINNFNTSIPKMTIEERQDRVNNFFNK